MAYPYTLKVDKNKITVGMARRLQSGSLDAMVDIVAALSVDAEGKKPDRDVAIAAIDDMSVEELNGLIDLLTENFSTPKES